MTDLGQQYCSQLQRRGMPRGSKVGGGQKGENVGRTSIEASPYRVRASRHRSSARRGGLGQSPYGYQNKTIAADDIPPRITERSGRVDQPGGVISREAVSPGSIWQQRARTEPAVGTLVRNTPVANDVRPVLQCARSGVALVTS